jgi:hypothetical protein
VGDGIHVNPTRNETTIKGVNEVSKVAPEPTKPTPQQKAKSTKAANDIFGNKKLLSVEQISQKLSQMTDDDIAKITVNGQPVYRMDRGNGPYLTW